MFLNALGPLAVSVLSVAVMRRWQLYERPSRAHPFIAQVGRVPAGTPARWGLPAAGGSKPPHACLLSPLRSRAAPARPRAGLPPPTVGWWLPLRDPGAQAHIALLICLLDALEAMSMAKSLAAKGGFEHDANQDLRALGAANLAGAALSCYNSTGSFSRSAVAAGVGARTPLASGVQGAAAGAWGRARRPAGTRRPAVPVPTGTCALPLPTPARCAAGVVLAATLLFLTPFVTHLSKNVQARAACHLLLRVDRVLAECF